MWLILLFVVSLFSAWGGFHFHGLVQRRTYMRMVKSIERQIRESKDLSSIHDTGTLLEPRFREMEVDRLFGEFIREDLKWH